MRAEILSIGTELLLGEIVDTNSAWLSAELAALGIDLYHRVTVGDNLQRITEALRQALGRSDLVVTSGGLGPTEDDVTREAVAAASGRPMVFYPHAYQWIEAFFRARGQEPSPNTRRQAFAPEGAELLPNPHGTAPGLFLPLPTGQHVVCLPGPPRELTAVFQAEVQPRLLALARAEGRGVLYSRILHFVGIGEAELEERVKDLLQGENPTVAPYARLGEVRLRLTARAPDTARAQQLIGPVEAEIRRRLGAYLYGWDADTLEEVVGRLLRAKGFTVAVAESMTGGLIVHRLTNVPGSSEYLERGLVTYSNRAKEELLGVSPETLGRHGAVSEQAAAEMAAGARARSGTDLGLSVTGIAGPGGATPAKPVGLTYIGLAHAGGVEVRGYRFVGERQVIKELAAQAALDLLRRHLAGLLSPQG